MSSSSDLVQIEVSHTTDGALQTNIQPTSTSSTTNHDSAPATMIDDSLADLTRLETRRSTKQTQEDQTLQDSDEEEIPRAATEKNGINGTGHRLSVIPGPPTEAAAEEEESKSSDIPPPPEDESTGSDSATTNGVNFHLLGGDSSTQPINRLEERRPSAIEAAAHVAAEVPPAQVLPTPSHASTSPAVGMETPVKQSTPTIDTMNTPSTPLQTTAVGAAELQGSSSSSSSDSVPLGLFSPTRPPNTPVTASSEMNIFSPTRPVFTPSAVAHTRPSQLSGTLPATLSPARPVMPPRPATLPYSRRQSLLNKNLNFKTCMKHQFPLIDAQITSGQQNVKRVATFLKKVCEASESHAGAMLKLTQSEEAKEERERHHEAMTDHFKAMTQITATVEALAIRDQIFAQKVLATVVKPLLQWLPVAEERRSKLVKEEKNISSSLSEKNRDAEKIRLNGLKSWQELQALKKEKDKEITQSGNNGKPTEKTAKKIQKLKEATRKEFAKFEALRDPMIARIKEWRSQTLPGLLQAMEALEKERLVLLKQIMEAFVIVLRESVGPEPQPLSILSTVEQQVELLNHTVDLNRFIENCIQTHGMPPADPAIITDLPCPSAELAPETERWETFGPASSSSSSTSSSSLAVPTSHTRAANGSSVPSLNGSNDLSNVDEDGAVSGSSLPTPSSTSSATVAPGGPDAGDDEDEDDEDGNLSTAQTIKEDWYVAQVDHPSSTAANAATATSASSSSTSSPSPADLPLLKFSVDDIVRVTDKVSGGDGWWIGSNVGELNGKLGRFPKNLVRSVEEKYIEPVSMVSEPGSGMDILRGKVSKKKKRFQADGFDLDLSYILPSIIAMGFPSEGLESTYRNPLSEVQRFFLKRHPENYKLYNLCSERSYDAAKFEGRVSRYPFDDHNPCAFDRILPIMQDIYQHLHPNGVFNPQRVAAIHCKAGKGRTGFIICCWLLYFGLFTTYLPELALRFYAVKRTKNYVGVNHPSQIRYVMYFARWLRQEKGLIKIPKIPSRNPVLLQQIRLMGIPQSSKGKDIWFKLVALDGSYSSKGRITPVRRLAEDYIFFQGGSSSVGIVALDQDVKITFFVGGMFDTTKLFQFWFNTRLIGMMEPDNQEKEVPDGGDLSLILTKAELDKACKDINHKLYADTFRVELVFTSA